jgi:hypothetical protein
VPLVHAPGEAQADFGEALVVVAGVERRRSSRALNRTDARGVGRPCAIRQRDGTPLSAAFRLGYFRRGMNG